jgi:hypothetical protein
LIRTALIFEFAMSPNSSDQHGPSLPEFAAADQAAPDQISLGNLHLDNVQYVGETRHAKFEEQCA